MGEIASETEAVCVSTGGSFSFEVLFLQKQSAATDNRATMTARVRPTGSARSVVSGCSWSVILGRSNKGVTLELKLCDVVVEADGPSVTMTSNPCVILCPEHICTVQSPTPPAA